MTRKQAIALKTGVMSMNKKETLELFDKLIQETKESIKEDHLKLAVETLKKVREDINWMMNEQKLLNPFVFKYLDETLEVLEKGV